MDLVGKRINELTVLRKLRMKGRVYYEVRCSCGKVFKTRRDSVTSQKTKSCGHLTQFKSKDLRGRKFGRLKVVKKGGINKEGRQLWRCRCECGEVTVATSNSLQRGNTKSCGCIRSEISKENKKHLMKWLKKDIVEGTSLRHIFRKEPISTNTSGVTGVGWDKSRNKWYARIEFQGERHFLGRFNKKEDAVSARKEAEDKYYQPIIEKYEKKS